MKPMRWLCIAQRAMSITLQVTEISKVAMKMPRSSAATGARANGSVSAAMPNRMKEVVRRRVLICA